MSARVLVATLAMFAAVLTPGVAHAAPPSNDDFDNAQTITALPFTGQVDATEATNSPDDPASCTGDSRPSVWYRYTPTADGMLNLTGVNSDGSRPFMMSVYTGTRGALNLVPGTCTSFPRQAMFFEAKAGVTYHIMLTHYFFGGPTAVDLRSVLPEPNDDLASATVSGFPATHSGDLARATAEPGEVVASCDAAATESVWYRYTPDITRFVTALRNDNGVVISVHRGIELSEVECQARWDIFRNAVFKAEAGQDYYVRVAAAATYATTFTLRLADTPALRPRSFVHPSEPNVFSDARFAAMAGDGTEVQIVSGEVRFGDGTSAPIDSEGNAWHRYTADGQYTVETSVTTKDGRTGTGSQIVNVVTHDVTLSKFVVPAKARAGQTKSIKVSVTNTRYDEEVTVYFRRLSEAGNYWDVGTLTQRVPVGATVKFPFSYTYTAADAAAGKVGFQISASIGPGFAHDDNPADNVLTAETSRIRPQPYGVI
jgi:hypothetical protein